MTKNKKQPILYFGNDWGADNKTSSHHIATRLMRDHFVVYIESPGLRAPQTSKRDISKIFAKLANIFKGVRKLDETNYVYTLFQVPLHKYSFINSLNKKLIVWQVKQLCKKLNINEPILWFLLPHVTPVLGKINEKLSVYYCVDDYAELPGVDKHKIEEMDKTMSEKCDLVFVTANPLLEKKSNYGEKVHLSLHGVDFDHFNSVANKEHTIPEEVKHLKSPLIGFFGLIERWIDLDLIKYLATERPDWQFLMIGRLAVEDNPCEKLGNVHFIGAKTYEELPGYAQSFDVSLIPCKNNELIRNFNPLKLREYLAMGTPVVTIFFPEIEEFKNEVSIAYSHEEFLSMIDVELKTNSSEKIASRVERVRPLSWENRYDYIKKIVDNKLDEKQNIEL